MRVCMRTLDRGIVCACDSAKTHECRWVILHAGAGDDKDQSHIAELKEATPSLFKGPAVEVTYST
jgi:hypothetical protein